MQRSGGRYRGYPVVFSPPAKGHIYVPISGKRTRVVKPGQSFMIGIGEKADIRPPFYNTKLKAFQDEVQGMLHAGDDGRLVYKERGKTGSAIMTFREPIRKATLRDPSSWPHIEKVEHLGTGAEADLSSGNKVLVLGVHPDTVRDKHLKFGTVTDAEGKLRSMVVDEHHNVYPTLVVPLSGERRYREDSVATVMNLAEDFLSDIQERYARRKHLPKATTTNLKELNEIVSDAKAKRKLELCVKFLTGDRKWEELKELHTLFGLNPPE